MSMATAPHARLVVAKLFGSWSNPSMVEVQLRPPSLERQIPPLAVAAYTRLPPVAMAIPETRPAIAARLTVCPRATTDGPSGVQLFWPAMAGMPGESTAMAGCSLGTVATRRRW